MELEDEIASTLCPTKEIVVSGKTKNYVRIDYWSVQEELLSSTCTLLTGLLSLHHSATHLPVFTVHRASCVLYFLTLWVGDICGLQHR